MKNLVRIYTDGACNGDKNGGIGIVLETVVNGGTIRKEIAIGYKAPTTNNRMELRAAIEALKAIKKPCMIEIVTDSQYVKKGITECPLVLLLGVCAFISLCLLVYLVFMKKIQIIN